MVRRYTPISIFLLSGDGRNALVRELRLRPIKVLWHIIIISHFLRWWNHLQSFHELAWCISHWSSIIKYALFHSFCFFIWNFEADARYANFMPLSFLYFVKTLSCGLTSYLLVDYWFLVFDKVICNFSGYDALIGSFLYSVCSHCIKYQKVAFSLILAFPVLAQVDVLFFLMWKSGVCKSASWGYWGPHHVSLSYRTWVK